MAQRMRAFILLTGILASNSPLTAAEREQREYVVYVNGKEAGQTTMDINVRDDGLTQVGIRARVKFQQFFVPYALTIEGTESWRDGKLTCIKCQATENGKKTDVDLNADAKQFRGRVNGVERGMSADTYSSSFWKLPDAKYHNKQLAVFEIDTGKEHEGKLQFIGKEQLTLLNRLQECYHFRYTGGSSPTDLWFDQYHRLVRQEFVEAGQRTIVQISSIRK